MEEDSYTTGQAAKILRVSDSYVRRLVRSGELEAVQDEGGRYLIPQRVVHAMLEERREEAPEPSESPSEAADLRRRLQKSLQRELGRLEGRLELTEKTERSMREERERLIEERERFIVQLEEERSERRRLQLELEAAYERERLARVSWWRRLLGR